MTEKLKYAIKALGDLILPRFCAVCGTRLTVEERFLCSDCEEDLPLTYYWDMAYNPAADRLNENIQRKFDTDFPVSDGNIPPDDGTIPIPDKLNDSDVGTNSEPTGETAAAEESLPYRQYEPYARFAALFFYNSDNGYRHICHRLKYSGDLAIGREYARRLADRLAASPVFSDVDLVVPVPLHWTRLRRRGYNQADVIAREVAARLGAHHSARLLVRCRRTETQTVLSVEEKKRNVEGAFAVRTSALARTRQWRPQHILIIDDVMTTGATIAACHLALRQAFPTPVRISAASLACVEGL